MKKKLIKSITAVLISGLIVFVSSSCANHSPKDAAAMNQSGVKASAVSFAEQGAKSNAAVRHDELLQPTGADSIERKLIKEGHLRFETNDIQQMRQRIGTLIQKYGAYISREDEHYSSAVTMFQNITIRIPKEHFDQFVTELTDGIKKFDEKVIDIQDVTEEFVDITARLRVKKETENTYLRLLQQAKTVKDILDIQNQIQNLRSDIEAIEGKLRYLENSINFSTLHINMYQLTGQSSGLASFLTPVWEAFKGGAELFASLCIALLYGWVFILLAIGVMIVLMKVKKYRKQKEKN